MCNYILTLIHIALYLQILLPYSFVHVIKAIRSQPELLHHNLKTWMDINSDVLPVCSLQNVPAQRNLRIVRSLWDATKRILIRHLHQAVGSLIRLVSLYHDWISLGTSVCWLRTQSFALKHAVHELLLLKKEDSMGFTSCCDSWWIMRLGN